MFSFNESLFLNRPISPHLTIYFPQISSVFSILHRLTGIGLIFILLYFVFLSNVLQNLFYFNYIIYVVKLTKLNNFFYLNINLIFFFHYFNGLKYVMWYFGFLINLKLFNYLFFILFISFFILILNFIFSCF